MALIADRMDDLYFLREASITWPSRTKNRLTCLLYGIARWDTLTHATSWTQSGIVRGIETSALPNEFSCEVCILNKITQTLFWKTNTRQSKPLEIAHTDVCESMWIESNGGARYFITFTDDHLRWVEIQHKEQGRNAQCIQTIQIVRRKTDRSQHKVSPIGQ